MREKLADLARIKEDDRRDLSARIEDLRHDRDDLRTERDRLLKVVEEQAGSMRVLTDQRAKPELASPTPSAASRRAYQATRAF